jgi:hypothetical protein
LLLSIGEVIGSGEAIRGEKTEGEGKMRRLNKKND